MYENLRSGYKYYLYVIFFLHIFLINCIFILLHNQLHVILVLCMVRGLKTLKYIYVKINCDASFKDLERVGIGFVVRNSNGDAEKI